MEGSCAGVKVQGRKVTVVGMGRSALGAVRLLLHQGARPFVTDASDGPSLAPHIAALDALGVPYETGGHGNEAFANAALVIVSPGVPPGIPPLAAARAAGIPVVGELEYASRFLKGTLLAVTGTNGKTTVTELLRHLIAGCGHSVALAGNNDTPLSEVALMEPQPDYVVAEVSSYQLEMCVTFHPHIAAVLNLTPDHLGRHGDMSGYAAVKAGLFARQGAGDVAVVNADDPWTKTMAVPVTVERAAFSIEGPVPDGVYASEDGFHAQAARIATMADNPLPGKHNRANVAAALAMVRAAGMDWERVVAALRTFRGVEHRIEPVCDIGGVPWYNDSKSTNIDSLRVALESFDRPIVLIAGGRGKGSDYGVLRDTVRNSVKTLVVIGEDAPLLEAAFGDLAPTRRAGSMAEAVRVAHAEASPGDVVLLSPGCASFDWYANFEERGRDFKACVQRLAGGAVA